MKTRCSALLIAICIYALPLMSHSADLHPGGEVKNLPPATATSIEPKIPDPATPAPKPDEVPVLKQVFRIGYVDIYRIGTESALGKKSQAQIKAKSEKYQSQLDAKRKQLDKQRADIEAKLPTLTPPQREAKTKEFQKKVEEFQKFGQKAEKELMALQEELTRAIFATVEQAAAEYGKANALELVVIKKELLYLAAGVDARDVSDDVLKLVNEKTKK